MKKRLLMFSLCGILTVSGCGIFQEDSGAYDAGLAALEKKDYITALGEFQDAANEDGRQVEAYRCEGIVYYEMQDYEHAIMLFEKSLSEMKFKKPEFSRDIYYYLGEIYQLQGEKEKALEVYGQLIKEEQDAQAYFLRGKLYLSEREDEKAKADFQKSLKKDEDFENYIRIYLAYAQQNRSADGSVYLEQVAAQTPDSPQGEYNQGRAYYYLEEYDKARAILIQADNDGSEESAILLGKLYLDTGDTANARAIYQNLLQAEKLQAAAYNGLALCDLADGNFDSAFSNISEGLALDDGAEEETLLYNEIVVYEKKLDFATAKAKMTEFLAKYPDNQDAIRENTFLQSRE
ncbi:MAG: tetratricopeptide repeat protein [Lachnospiraceae bacterium]|nr:tetratricopeptide repeat protein [Lachnospiraceae bacterium]